MVHPSLPLPPSNPPIVWWVLHLLVQTLTTGGRRLCTTD